MDVDHSPPASPPLYSISPTNDAKRIRSGTISLRLRSASDLEFSGMIDSIQKEMMKDKIVSGEPALLRAMDKYSEGDPSDLQGNSDNI
jgi:hypothetical protein